MVLIKIQSNKENLYMHNRIKYNNNNNNIVYIYIQYILLILFSGNSEWEVNEAPNNVSLTHSWHDRAHC